ncbi:hypothetical protein KBC59_00135 [Patescibacteria group bacterium]|nr:hypothetical protein [Patescibacteria group bacterium]
MPFEIENSTIQVTGGTRPGLVIASIQGLNMIVDATPNLDAEDIEHPFSFSGNSFPELLQQLLQEALKIGQTNKESFLDLKLTLITDAKIEGAFVGKPATIQKAFSQIAVDGNIAKGEDGQWHATVRVS